MRIRRRSLWVILVAVATVILVVLLALIAVGTLSLPGKAPPPDLRIYQAEFSILQGENSSGLPWFGPNFTYEGVANGYPFSLTPGARFTLPLLLYNYDTTNHTIYSMSASPPFSLVASSPGLPRVVAPVDLEDDSGSFDLTLLAPNSPGDNVTLYITIDALAP